jgi:small subunit ribosomal protein S19e
MAKTIHAQNPQEYLPKLAEALQKIPEFKTPEWAHYTKSGTSKQRPPTNKDFWHLRAASILRQLYIKGVVGVGRLRTRYGTRKDRGTKPDEFRKAGGKIIRVILQQAEEAGLVEKLSRLQHGRRLTQQGRDLLDSITVPQQQGLQEEEFYTLKDEVQEEKEENEETKEEQTEEETEQEEKKEEKTEETEQEEKKEEKTEEIKEKEKDGK